MSFAERLRRLAHGGASHAQLLEFGAEFRRMAFHIRAGLTGPASSARGARSLEVCLIDSDDGDLPLLFAGCDPARVAEQLEVPASALVEVTGEDVLSLMAGQAFHLCVDPDEAGARDDRSEVLSHEQLQVFAQLEHIRSRAAAPTGVRRRLKGGHRLH